MEEARSKMEEKRPMTMREAGRRGGQATAARHGHDFYQAIGRKGGGRMRELIAAGKAAEARRERGEK